MITAATAQQIFQRLTALHAGDGCEMNGLATENSVMRATWIRNGTLLPAVIVTPVACAPRTAAREGRYVITPNPTFVSTCPATFVAVRRAFARDAPAPTTVTTGTRPRSHRRLVWTLGVSALLALIAAAGWYRWRSKDRQPTEDEDPRPPAEDGDAPP